MPWPKPLPNCISILQIAAVVMLAGLAECRAQHCRCPSEGPFTQSVPNWLWANPVGLSAPQNSAVGDAEGCGDESSDAEESSTLFSSIPHDIDAITFEAIYTGEVFSNTRGGLNTNNATRYRGVAELAVTADLDKLFGMTGTSVFINAGQMHGNSISVHDVGDWQFVSNIDSTPFPHLTQLNEYWLSQKLGETIWFKVGRIDANADFGFADLAGDFANSSFGQMPTIPLPVWPTQSLGATGFFNLTDDLLLAAGTFKGNTMAANWGSPVLDALGYVTLGHLELKTAAGPNELPGTWRIGSWYQSGDWKEITAAPVARTFGDNYGVWCTADQMLIQEESSDEIGQGLGAFFEYGWSPEDRNFVRQSYGAGFVYRGLLDDRDSDVLGIGLARVEFGAPTRIVNASTVENTWELFYKYQARSYFSLQPDIQYVDNPSGILRDALVVGLRCELAL